MNDNSINECFGFSLMGNVRQMKTLQPSQPEVPDEFKPHLTCPICGKTNYALFRNLLEVHRTNEILLGQYYCCSSHCGLHRGTLSPDVNSDDGIFCIPA